MGNCQGHRAQAGVCDGGADDGAEHGDGDDESTAWDFLEEPNQLAVQPNSACQRRARHMKKVTRPQPCTNHPVKCTAGGGGRCHGFAWSQTVKRHCEQVHGGAAVPAKMESEVSNQEQEWVKFAGPKGKEVPAKWQPDKEETWKK